MNIQKDKTESENFKLSDNFLFIDGTYIPWRNIVGIQKRSIDDNTKIEGVIKLMHEKGYMTSGDQNISIMISVDKFYQIINEWHNWIEKTQQASINSGKSFFQAEEKMFEDKLNHIVTLLSSKVSECILETNESYQQQIDDLKNKNTELSEIISSQRERIETLFENLSNFITDLSDIEETYESIKDDIIIDNSINYENTD